MTDGRRAERETQPSRAPLVVDEAVPTWSFRRGPRERVLRFPPQRSVGVLYVSNKGPKLFELPDGRGLHEWWRRGAARATVTVPARTQVWLAASHNVARDLSFLSDLAPGGLQALNLSGISLCGDQVSHVAAVTGLHDVNLSMTGITDDGVPHLGDLTRLKRLDLSENPITDDGLRHVIGLHDLRQLNLKGTAIQGAGLAHAASLAALKFLNLAATDVDDASLAHLTGHRALDYLSLQHSRISDEGLTVLAGMTTLGGLDIGGVRGGVTAEAICGLSSLRGLRFVSLAGLPVTDTVLRRLREAWQLLMAIDLRKTSVSQKAVMTFLSGRYDCTASTDYGDLWDRMDEYHSMFDD